MQLDQSSMACRPTKAEHAPLLGEEHKPADWVLAKGMYITILSAFGANKTKSTTIMSSHHAVGAPERLGGGAGSTQCKELSRAPTRPSSNKQAMQLEVLHTPEGPLCSSTRWEQPA